MSEGIISRLREALTASGKSARSASLEAGLSDSALRVLMKNPQSSPTVETLNKLARAMGCSPEWLVYGIGAEGRPDLDDGYLQIIGKVEAGDWLDIDPLYQPGEFERAPIAITPEYPRSAQYGLRVQGTSINRRAAEGDILRCIDIGISGIEPLPGDLVIVQRERDDGQLREVTAKILTKDGGVIRLEPDSTDPHKAIILDPNRHDPHVTVRIVAIVDLILRPIRRGKGK
jgi:transcriptional regulator with XRE-family HTH domain